MSLEVVVHYRPANGDGQKLQRIVEAALKDFPTRTLPQFVPWFPNEKIRLPLKPKLQAPIISSADVKNVQKCFSVAELLNMPQSFDCTVSLLEFHPNLTQRKLLLQAQTVSLDLDYADLQELSLKRSRPLRRRWSVSAVSDCDKHKVPPLSMNLQQALDRLNLHSFYRARWTIEQSVGGRPSLEDIWIKLNSIIKHNTLPLCNATIQRDICQIWVFCDIFYCEYIGAILKEKLNLLGKIHLFVHKYGVIFSL